MIYKSKTKNIKKIIALILVLILSINCFAAVVSDNDGSAFITKAEFDSLKNNFQSQLGSYYTAIDSKIDNAIAQYLIGTKIAEETIINLSLPDEVYCMLNRSDTETKDLQYVYARPEITGGGLEWHANTGGTYAYSYTLNSRAGEGTGERNMIDDLYLTDENGVSSARWVGHWKNVKEKYVLNISYGMIAGEWGKHNSTGQFETMINPNYSELSHVLQPMTGNLTDFCSWNISIGNSLGNKYGNNGYGFKSDYPFDSLKFSSYTLEKQSNFEESKKDLVVFYPETYYGFTYNNENQNFIGFDRYKVTSNVSSTVCPTLHSDYPNLARWNGGTHGNGPTTESYTGNVEQWFSTMFNTATTLTAYRGYFQTNFAQNYATTGNLTNRNKYWVDPYYADYNDAHGAQGTNNYLYKTKRFPWPVVSFPWYYISDWSQLWQSQTDWAVDKISNFDETSWVYRWFNDEPHISLAAGYPIFEVKKDKNYKFEIKFKEDNDHLLFLHYGPYYTFTPETENINAITEFEKSTNVKKDTRYTNALLIKANETAKIEFKAENDNVIFIKWCDNPAPTYYINGGGTVVLPKTVTEITSD